jgi:hypothetical protein
MAADVRSGCFQHLQLLLLLLQRHRGCRLMQPSVMVRQEVVLVWQDEWLRPHSGAVAGLAAAAIAAAALLRPAGVALHARLTPRVLVLLLLAVAVVVAAMLGHRAWWLRVPGCTVHASVVLLLHLQPLSLLLL